MPRRRRNFRKKSFGGPKPRRTSGKAKKSSLKERLLTVAIWALGLMNVVLIVSFVSDFFGSPHEKPVSMNLPPETEQEVQERVITVEVLNACGVNGLARDFTKFLRTKNFDVMNTDDYEGGYDLEKTYVLDRTSLNNENAIKVAEALGVSRDQVKPQLEPSRQLMVTVLLGKDYKKLQTYKEVRQLRQ
ncbi:MAG: LytR C-terminal domain-containing protein [bacterium]